MFRGVLPFVLASLGFAMIILAMDGALLEWQISEIVTDFPPTHEVGIVPSPWVAGLGESLDDGSYVFKKIHISKDKRSCRKEVLTLVVERSLEDKSFEQVWLNIYRNTSWLFGWSWIEVILSIMYIFLFTIFHKEHSAIHALLFMVIALCLFLNLTQILRNVAPLSHPYFGTVDCYPGVVTFNARLSKLYYEAPIFLFVGILSELGGIAVIVYQIMKGMSQGRESAKSVVG